MNKHIIFIGILGVITIIMLFGQNISSFIDLKYLQGKSQHNYLPKDIQQKHNTTIEKVDALIKKENTEAITSRSKSFDLQVYLKNIQVGVFPYLKKEDPLRQDVQLLMQDISSCIK